MSRQRTDRLAVDRGFCNGTPLEPLQDLQPATAAGRLVEARGEQWRVRDVRQYESCAALYLTGAAHSNAGRLKTLLHPFDRIRPVVAPARLRRVGRRRWIGEFARLTAALAQPCGLRAAAAAGIDLLGWQFEPALAFLSGAASRVLLADQVGLGKTIQAALVIAELRARHDLAHVLIVVPPGLRDQWAGELRDRFAVEALVMDAAALSCARADHLASVNPWSVAPVVISSLDLVKRPEVLPGPAAIIWDLLVIDEAHTVSAAPERHHAAAALARLSRRVMLLTATPHCGDQAAFRALCEIGKAPGEPPVMLIHRTRESVGYQVSRRVHLLRVRPSPAEHDLHHLLARYAARVLRESSVRGDPVPRLAMIVLAKRAFSSARALAQTLERRAALLRSGARERTLQLDLPLDEEDEDLAAQETADDDVLGCPGLDDRATECEWLSRLANAARGLIGNDRKMWALLRLLRRSHEPAVVFTEYKDTLEQVLATIGGARSIAQLHGGLNRAERLDALDRFSRGAADVLVATDVGGQGLNLQDTCRLVVSVELPWNPMRLEQRIGRVDRLGQRRLVHAVHLLAAGTAEQRVLGRLVARLASARAALGDAGQPLGRMTEEAVADAVLADAAFCERGAVTRRGVTASRVAVRSSAARGDPLLAESPFSRPDAGASLRADAELERIARVRRLLSIRSREGGGRSPGVPVATMSRRTMARMLPRGAEAGVAVVALHATRIVDARGALVEEDLWPLRIERKPGAGRIAPHLLACLSRTILQNAAALHDAALRATSDRIARLAPAHRRAAGAVRAREEAIAGVLAQERVGRGGPVQAGLFDRRALDEAERALVDVDRLLERIRSDDRASDELSVAGEPELVMVLVLGR